MKLEITHTPTGLHFRLRREHYTPRLTRLDKLLFTLLGVLFLAACALPGW